MTPCNFHLRALAEKVKEGVRAAGGTPIEFDTIAVSDGITMGTEGMKASLISREVIADSIELFVRAHAFDAVVAICGCDKTIPGTVMALARLNLPSLSLYGGSIMPGHFHGHEVTIQDVFEAVGACAAGKMTRSRSDRARRQSVSRRRARAAANTPPTPCPPRSHFWEFRRWAQTKFPPSIRAKQQVAVDCGKIVMDLFKRDIRPSQIITAGFAAQRDRVRFRNRRFHERRSASARHCPRYGRAFDHRRIR